jgi:RNA polymerase sigma-70 factor (ECF subfamily)
MRLAIPEPWRTAKTASDAELVAHARAGEEPAIRALIRRHNPRLFRIARGVVRDDAEAEDVVQETWVRAFTSLDSFRGEAAFSTWLTRIALNEALGRLRRHRPMADLSEIDAGAAPDGDRVIMFTTIGQTPGPESETGREQVRRLLERAVDELAEPFRMVFILRDVQGLSTEETAEALSIRPETVKTRLHRARAMMRASLERSLAPRFGDLFPFDGERCVRMADRVVARLDTR